MALRTNPQILGETGAGKVWTCSLAGKIDFSCANIWYVSQSTHSIDRESTSTVGKKTCLDDAVLLASAFHSKKDPPFHIFKI